ncbi:hypothetical protein BDY21DRAFT_349450 [Lineolata rhizophorae]|uniref:Uncharacterized protein n=1 Tax=Lineolata rhizophorae TaxID=578093 RepID=A0A6A6NUT3_9PEZI|nr:hypothetical protein BDY21DRAFT_349450 [Lineolata rhizophorae]
MATARSPASDCTSVGCVCTLLVVSARPTFPGLAAQRPQSNTSSLAMALHAGQTTLVILLHWRHPPNTSPVCRFNSGIKPAPGSCSQSKRVLGKLRSQESHASISCKLQKRHVRQSPASARTTEPGISCQSAEVRRLFHEKRGFSGDGFRALVRPDSLALFGVEFLRTDELALFERRLVSFVPLVLVCSIALRARG